MPACGDTCLPCAAYLPCSREPAINLSEDLVREYEDKWWQAARKVGRLNRDMRGQVMARVDHAKGRGRGDGHGWETGQRLGDGRAEGRARVGHHKGYGGQGLGAWWGGRQDHMGGQHEGSGGVVGVAPGRQAPPGLISMQRAAVWKKRC